METHLSLDGTAVAAARALAVDTDTRAETAEIAFTRTRAAAREAIRARSRVDYKKIDSTLRGHVGPEIAAVFAAAIETADVLGDRPIVLLSPAFPALGRIVRAGRGIVDGAELEAKPIAFLAAAGIAAAQVATATNASVLARDIERRAAEGADAVVCDAESDADLQVIAEAGGQLTRPVLWAGSGGLVTWRALASRCRGPRRGPIGRRSGRGPSLILVGSPSDVAQRQAADLARAADLTTVTVARDSCARARVTPRGAMPPRGSTARSPPAATPASSWSAPRQPSPRSTPASPAPWDGWPRGPLPSARWSRPEATPRAPPWRHAASGAFACGPRSNPASPYAPRSRRTHYASSPGRADSATGHARAGARRPSIRARRKPRPMTQPVIGITMGDGWGRSRDHREGSRRRACTTGAGRS
jgi:hypothetical protein